MTVSGGSFDRWVDLAYEQLKKQGFNFLLLALAIWYFHDKNEKMNAELDKCNSAILQMYREDRTQAYELVQNNTKALIELRESIKNMN